MRGWWSDVRLGARMLLKRPGTSLLAISALTLGIGLTTMMFSIVDAVFLRGLPFEQPDRLAVVSRLRIGAPRGGGASTDELIDWRASQRVFEDLGGSSRVEVNLASPGELAQHVRGAYLTINVLRLLRASPALGRGFTDADAAPGAPLVVLIGDGLWRERFQRRPDVIGRSMRV